MQLAFDEAQEELRAQARAFLADHSGPEQVRQAMASELGYDAEVWKRIGSELGWPALLVPEGDDFEPAMTRALSSVVGDRQTIAALSARARALGKPDAACRVADICRQYLGEAA